jgi:hypothetical protein
VKAWKKKKKHKKNLKTKKLNTKQVQKTSNIEAKHKNKEPQNTKA